jgi:hypothetical protein
MQDQLSSHLRNISEALENILTEVLRRLQSFTLVKLSIEIHLAVAVLLRPETFNG